MLQKIGSSLLALALYGYPLAPSAASAASSLRTWAEQTEWKQTGRYSEVADLCAGLARRFPQTARCFSYGRSPEGRELWALAAGRPGFLSPSSPAKRGPKAPVVLFQGGIHAGEIEGKDAGLLFLREVLEGKTLPGVLKQLTLVFVPVFNVDGHERFQANNRPNQNGPEAMGWRTTAQNFNLNRDYTKAEAPEMRAMLGLLQAWDPLVYIDLHTTDGAHFRHDIAVMIEPFLVGPQPLLAVAQTLREQTMSELKASGHLPLWFYPSFKEDDNPASGIATGPQSPRFSNGYWGLRNRLGVLVETHSWRPYDERVRASFDALRSIVGQAAKGAAIWRQAMVRADAETAKLAAQEQALSYKNTERRENFDFLGYAYTREPSTISGQLVTRYDTTRAELWKLPLQAEVVPELVQKAPGAGYLVPPAYRELVAAKLKVHGLRSQIVQQPAKLQAQVYRCQDVKLAAKSYEGRQRAEVSGQWQPSEESIVAGSLWIPIAQPGARLLMRLLEPASPDSLLAWGFMNEIFERKEYMEAYVAEDVAVEMLKDPEIKREFEKRLKDPDFAKDPAQRLDFFYQRHPSFDARWQRYPVLRVDTPLAAQLK